MSSLNITSRPSTNQLKPLLHIHHYMNNKNTVQLNHERNMPTNQNQPDPVLAVEVIAMVNMDPTTAPPNAQSGANSAITAKFLTNLHLYVNRNHLNQPVLLLLRFIMTHNRTHIRIAPIQDINEIPALICSTKSNHCNCNPVLINIFPDSGATICLAGQHHLQQLNLKQENLICCHKEVKAVGGFNLICHGWLPMNFTIGKHTATQQVYFCDKVNCFYFSKKDAWIYAYYHLNFHTPWTLPTQPIPPKNWLQPPPPPRLSL